MGKRRRQSTGEEEPVIESQTARGEEAPSSKKARVTEKKTLFVRSLPASATTESLTEWFSQHYPVKHATVVLDSSTKASRGYGFVTLTDPEDAAEAKEKLNNSVFEGRRLKLDYAESRHRDGDGGTETAAVVSRAKDERLQRKAGLQEAKKPAKLIIRNLPWSIKHSDQLAALFQSYGKVRFADVPNDKGKLAGFGFVTMRGRRNAEKAIDGVNGKVVDGRTVAVDWAVDKRTWEGQKPAEEQSANQRDRSQPRPEVKAAAEDSQQEQEVEDDEDDEDADVRNFMESHMDDLESEDGEDGEDGDEVDSARSVADESAPAGEDQTPASKASSTDNSTTLFIRNLPFTTTEAELKSHFAQFGPVRYARCVMDRATDRPAGTGFVCFFNLDDCKGCVRSAPRPQPATSSVKHSVLQNESVDHDGRYTLEGRVLQVSQAVSKDEATRLAAEGPGAKARNERDKRRLFLLAEGTIPTNSPMAAVLAPSELTMREASAKQRKKLVESNPSLFISLTRIALRNIPRNLDSKALKALGRQACVEFAKDVKAERRQPLSREENARGGLEDKEAERRRKEKGQGVVRQAKVIFESRDGSKVTDRAAGDPAGSKSRGYGFIEYSSHRWALMGLRWLNGHALKNEAGKTQRLIAEFAIENAQVVLRRKTAQEKARVQAKEGPTGKPALAGKNVKGKPGMKPKAAPFRKAAKESNAAADTTGVASGPPGPSRPGKSADAGSSKLAVRQQIIGRKRMMRKQKRGPTGKKA